MKLNFDCCLFYDEYLMPCIVKLSRSLIPYKVLEIEKESEESNLDEQDGLMSFLVTTHSNYKVLC